MFVKSTTIYGRTDLDQAHRRILYGAGHWQPKSALAYAQRRGIIGPVEVEHCVSDTSGHGRGGIDRRFQITQSGLVSELTISPTENDDYAEADLDSVHDAWDSAYA